MYEKTSANNIQYTANYDSSLLRGKDDIETPRPWNLFAEIKQHSGGNKILLDIGCGTAFKIIPLAECFKKIIAVEPSQSMLCAAQKNIFRHGIKNITLFESVGEYLPLGKNSIDVITCMLSRWDIGEIHRVLKPEGVVFVEHVGCEDKREFKLFFGKDQSGWRGQFINYSVNEYIEMYRAAFLRFFKKVSIKNGFWNTYYTVEGLRQLLKYTPTIRNYHVENDETSFKEALRCLSTRQGIKLIQNRILIYVKDPRAN